jgi:hypothetical protein
MSKITEYYNFIEENGISLSTLNHASKERALEVKGALIALDLLYQAQIAISGGDILTDNKDKLGYAYHVWGDQYVYLDWSIDEMKRGETREEYVKRSYDLAEKSIQQAAEVAKKLGKKCYIVLVI